MNRHLMRAAKANGRRMMKGGWSAWEDVTAQIKAIRERASKDPESFVKAWKNNLFICQLYRKSSDFGVVHQLMIRRNDEGTSVSWATKQRIKNELLGAEVAAIEVYPAASKLVDDANMYHLWILPNGFDLPIEMT